MTIWDVLQFMLMASLIGISVYAFLLAACWLVIEVVKRWVDLGKKSGER